VNPALVILAAGASTRLGTCKALVELGGKTALARLLAAGAASSGAPPLVVTGADHAAIAAALPGGVAALENPRWAEGRAGGVALAARARPGLDLCLAPVDVPLVPARVFSALAAAWQAAGAPARGWLAPCVAVGGSRRFGHPVVLGRDLVGLLAAARKDLPISALRAEADPLLAVEVESLRILDDLDTPADRDRLDELA
jgi:CTP:molybdopterin cytidylyltransferase MocA